MLSLIQAVCLVTKTPKIEVSANVTLEEDHQEDTETRGGERSHATNSTMTCPHSFLKEEHEAMKPLQDEQARQTTKMSVAKQKYLFSVTCEQSRSQGSQNDHSEEERPKEKEASEGPERQESETSYISVKCLREATPQKNVHRLPGIRRIYTFKQSVENLHMGRPAFSSGDLNPCERTKCLMRVELVRGGTPEGERRSGGDSPQGESSSKPKETLSVQEGSRML